MKKLQLVILSLCLALAVMAIAYAASSFDVTINAVVPDITPDINIVTKELTQANQSPWDGTTVTTMGFGTLTHLLDGGGEAGAWFSKKYFAVMIFTNGFGKKYEVRSTCAGLTSGGNSIPANSFGLTPQYVGEDKWSSGDAQGGKPAGATLGSAGSAITTNKSIYQSEAGGSARIIRAFYSLPPFGSGGALPFPGYQPIPLTQAPGTYAGTVTITIAQI